VDSPTGLLLCLGAYFVIVFLGLALQSGRAPVPAEAKRPDPFWLRALVLLHNLFLVALSLFMSGGCASADARAACADKRTPQARARVPRGSARRPMCRRDARAAPCVTLPRWERGRARMLARLAQRSRSARALTPLRLRLCACVRICPPRSPRRSVAYYAYEGSYVLWGNAYKPTERGMATMIYIFFVSKIYEFMDTFIMLLKGNLQQARANAASRQARQCVCVCAQPARPQQVTLLHVYHHASISFIWWMITHTAPGGDAYFSAALNSFVHVVMYTYYLLAILLGKDKRVRDSGFAQGQADLHARIRRTDARRSAPLLRQMRDRYLWWGRYVTQFQMAQFCANLAQAWYCMRNSPYPRFMSELLLWYMVSLLFLFGAPPKCTPGRRACAV
jgi:hypothetical protein